MYLDCICIDQQEQCSLEPGYGTLGFWNLERRNKAEAWQPLGYIANFCLSSKNENKFWMHSVTKLQIHHENMGVMLELVVHLQSKGGIPFSFVYHGKQCNARPIGQFLCH